MSGFKPEQDVKNKMRSDLSIPFRKKMYEQYIVWFLKLKEPFTVKLESDLCAVENALQTLISARKLNSARLHVEKREATAVKSLLDDIAGALV